MTSHRRRITALERRFTPADAMPIRISGGLPDDERYGVTVDSQEFERGPDEALRAFETRVLVAAKTVRQRIVIIGGLPDS